MANYRKYAGFFIGMLMLFLYIGCTPGKTQMKQNNNDETMYNQNSSDPENNEGRKGGAPVVRSGMKNDDNQGNGKYKNSQRGGYADGRGKQNGRNGDKEDNHRNIEKVTSDENTFSSEKNDDLSRDSMRGDNGDSDRERQPQANGRDSYFQTGTASWYGREFHGKVTASGEKFNMNKYTAAHKTLPFGTLVEVKNLDNGKMVQVEINDRGPYKGNRIIDISYGAAKNLAMLSTGVARVGIRVIKNGDKDSENREDNRYGDSGRKGDSRYGDSGRRDIEPVVGNDADDTERGSRTSKTYSIQAGAFYSKRNAESLKKKIEGLTRNSVSVVNDGDLYKVRVDGIESKKEAKKFKNILNNENIKGYILE